MGFLINCTTKGCRQEVEPMYDSVTNVASCPICLNEITNITQFAKNQMKSLGHAKREDVKTAFSVKCVNCGKIDKPDVKGNKGFCKSCKCDMKLTGPFLQMMKVNKFSE